MPRLTGSSRSVSRSRPQTQQGSGCGRYDSMCVGDENAVPDRFRKCVTRCAVLTWPLAAPSLTRSGLVQSRLSRRGFCRIGGRLDTPRHGLRCSRASSAVMSASLTRLSGGRILRIVRVQPSWHSGGEGSLVVRALNVCTFDHYPTENVGKRKFSSSFARRQSGHPANPRGRGNRYSVPPFLVSPDSCAHTASASGPVL